ncbi:hypothetical protein [Nannocystis pusilla]|uniref:Lipoprotein n=1 Tax=Nannocystis pusilla TaxID=889268 RepID=A0ABS7TJ15_9BACT|nr:hypothetical protein [Nannocystis pusilla]MBZ5708218.1 hypothetical protein [Nannocystis pusilla]
MAWSLLVFHVVAGCSLRPYEFGESATEATSTGTMTTTTAAAMSTSVAATSHDEPTTGVASGSTSAASTDHGGSFTAGPDLGPSECDPWRKACPEGQKCMPYSGDGDHVWESWGCFDLVPDPAGVDEPCMVIDSGVSGKDSCDDGLMCWFVDWDTGMGTCLSMCTGSPEAPTCPEPMTSCTITAEATLILCLPHCDPLAQDCTGGDLCIPNPQDPNSFLCVLDASGEDGQVFDVCEHANGCDPGLVCHLPEFAVECDPSGLGCCLPFCDVSQPNTCPGQGQECLAWFDPGQAPPGYENVGLCGVPSP